MSVTPGPNNVMLTLSGVRLWQNDAAHTWHCDRLRRADISALPRVQPLGPTPAEKAGGTLNFAILDRIEMRVVDAALVYDGPGTTRTCNQTVMSGEVNSEFPEKIEE